MKKILAIDDQKDNLITIKAVIKNNMPDCEVLTALSGKDGIEIAREEQPDTILLDIIMPQMDGYEVCKRLKDDELTKYIPVLMLTAIKTDSDSRVKGLDLGADAFLSKPIDPIELSAQIRVMLRIKEAEDKLRADKKNLEELVLEKIFELKESEEKYRAIYNNAPLSYQSLDINGCFLDVNPTWMKVLGYEEKEVIGKCFSEFLHPDWKPHFEKNFKEFKRRGSVSDVQFKIKHKEGHYIDISFEGCVGLNSDSSFKQTYCVFQDITERKQVAEALLESEERFNLAMDATKDGIFDWNLLSNEIYYSPSWKKMLGYEDDELPNDFSIWEKLTSPEDVKKSWKLQNEVINKKRDRFEMEFKMKHKDGYWVEVLSRAEAVFDKSGKAIRMVGTHIDITERKQAEEALKNSEERFKIIFESAPDTYYLNNFEGKFVDANNAAKKLLGYSKEEFMGKSFVEMGILCDDEIEKAMGVLNENIKGKSTGPDEYRLKKKDGTEVNVEILTHPVKIAGEGMVLGIARNISKRKQVEEALKESETRFKALHNASFGGIAIHDKGVIIDCNQGLSTISGYTTEELIGADGVKLLIAEESHEIVMANIKASYEKAYEVVGIRKNGDKYPLRLEARMIPYEGREVRVVEFRDITEQKKTEQKLTIALENATESDRLKSAFLATMSHELRTPLNAIIGFSDIISEELSIEDIVSFNKNINSSGYHLLSIVEDLFDITLIETGQTRIKLEDVNVYSVLNDVQEIVVIEQLNTNKNNLEIKRKTYSENEEFIVHTDSSKLKQVLINLLKNAIKFTHEGFISYGFEIETIHQKSMLKFYVEDTGIGIPEGKRELIFDVFRQVEDSDTRLYGGTGIGLSISKKITELLGGEIWLESEEGKGSTFYFTIPLKGEGNFEEIIEDVEIESEIKRGSPEKKTILIVEDVEESLELLKILVEGFAYETLIARNGQEAVNICKENSSIDLVLMDVNMPIMNGYEATKEIKRFRPELPIISQTAYATIGDKEKSFDAGCDDYISKPIKRGDLAKKIEQLLRFK